MTRHRRVLTVPLGFLVGTGITAAVLGLVALLSLIIGALLVAAGLVITVLCVNLVITDDGVCTAGHWMIGIGAVLIVGALVTSAVVHGGTLTIGIDAGGRSVPIYSVDIPPAVPAP